MMECNIDMMFLAFCFVDIYIYIVYVCEIFYRMKWPSYR